MSKSLLLSCFSFLAGEPSTALAAADSHPNIVFILADDLGLGNVGCYGGKALLTPNIDQLAVEGVRFVNAYSASAVGAPARCGLMTGKHMGHATRRANASKNGLIPLRDDELAVAELLKAQGYATGGFGKWGLGNPGKGDAYTPDLTARLGFKTVPRHEGSQRGQQNKCGPIK